MKKERGWFRFGLRSMFVLVAIAAIPAWWFATMRSAYVGELQAIERIRKIAPKLVVEDRFSGPDWMIRAGFTPKWLNRVWAVDLNGTVLGHKPPTVDGFLVFEVDDAQFDSVYDDLRKFVRMKKLYLAFTELTDESIPELMEFDQVDFLNLQHSALTSAGVRKLEAALPGTKIMYFHGFDQLGNPVPAAPDSGSMEADK